MLDASENGNYHTDFIQGTCYSTLLSVVFTCMLLSFKNLFELEVLASIRWFPYGFMKCSVRTCALTSF